MATEMAVYKIRQIGRDILDEPRRFNMAMWLRKLSLEDWRATGRTARTAPPCGTTACFAGEWAIRYLGVDPGASNPLDDAAEAASEALGMDVDHSIARACQSDLGLPDDHLFYEFSWPDCLSEGLSRYNPGTKAYARYFVNVVLEDYIRTNGWTDHLETGEERSNG